MGAEQHDLLGVGGAAHLADDVGRRLVGERAAGEPQVETHRLPARELRRQHVGVGHRQRRRRHLRRVAVEGGAGVREAVVAGGHRADEHRQRALATAGGRPVAADADPFAVAALVLGAFHAAVEVDDAAADLLVGRRLQCLDRREADHLGGDPILGSADAAAERGEQHRLRIGRQDLARVLAAHPVRHRHRLALHVVEAEALHRRERPLDGALVAGRAGGARPHLGGDRGEQLPRGVAREGLLAQRGDGWVTRGLRPTSSARPIGDEGDGDECGEAYERCSTEARGGPAVLSHRSGC